MPKSGCVGYWGGTEFPPIPISLRHLRFSSFYYPYWWLVVICKYTLLEYYDNISLPRYNRHLNLFWRLLPYPESDIRIIEIQNNYRRRAVLSALVDQAMKVNQTTPLWPLWRAGLIATRESSKVHTRSALSIQCVLTILLVDANTPSRPSRGEPRICPRLRSSCCSDLVQDCHGNYVIQFVMRNGWDADRAGLIREVQANLLDSSKLFPPTQHKFRTHYI